MFKKASLRINSILAAAAILTILSSGLHLSYAQSNQDLQTTILDVHNKERSAVGVAPPTWSNSLAAGAQTWANHLATTGQFAHDPVHTGLTCTGPCYGENIAGFINGVSEPNGGQSKWVNEKSQYQGGPSFYAVGHYTQMVWDKTKQVGCATAPPSAHPYSILLCRYDPPGNYPNELPYPSAAPPNQAVGELENTFTESGALPLEQTATAQHEGSVDNNAGGAGGSVDNNAGGAGGSVDNNAGGAGGSVDNNAGDAGGGGG